MTTINGFGIGKTALATRFIVAFVLACLGLSLNTIIHFPENAGIGVGILLLGVVVYQFWRKRA